MKTFFFGIWMSTGLAFGFFSSKASFAVVTKPASAVGKLAFITVAVNGQEKRVENGEELVVVKGDVLKIIGATLRDGSNDIGFLNLVGYRSSTRPDSPDDRGEAVRTDRELMKSWSVNRDGAAYRIKAVSMNRPHGECYIRVVQPELRYFVMSVNGKRRFIRPSDALELASLDQVVVTEVATNVFDQNQEVKFRIVPLDESRRIHGRNYYELQFSRLDEVFATVPLSVPQ